MELLAEVARRYRDVSYIRAGPTGFYLLSHPELISSVLVRNDDRFERVPGERNYSRWVLGDALFTSEGELHARQRALIEPVMYGDVPAEHAGEVVELATEMTAAWQAGQTLDILEHHEQLTQAIMIKVLFGADGSRGAAIARALLDAIEASDSIPLAPTRIPDRIPFPSKRRFRHALADLHRLIEEAVAREDSTGPARNVLSELRRSRDQNGGGMSAEQARDEAISLYRGQKRVASAALTWSWYLLSQHPDAEARFHDEIDSAIGDRPPTFGDLPRLPYVLMVFREALRLYPSSWILARKAVAPHPAGDYEIPIGANVLVSPWVQHRDPRFWSDPERFDPERFAGGAPDPSECKYFPQGAGPKRCPGMDLLPMEAVMVLATIGRRWRLRLAPGPEPVPWATVFLAPKGEMPMIVEPRS